jgi:hypothetical protein
MIRGGGMDGIPADPESSVLPIVNLQIDRQ